MFSTSKTSSKWWVNIWYREIIRNPCFPRKTDKWTIKTAVEFFRQISHNFAECFFAKELETFIFTKILFIRKVVCLQLSKEHELENGASVTRWKVGVDMPKKKNRLCPHYHSFRFTSPFFFYPSKPHHHSFPHQYENQRFSERKKLLGKRNFHLFFLSSSSFDILTFFVIVNTRHLCKWNERGIFMHACQRNVFQWTFLTSFGIHHELRHLFCQFQKWSEC